MKHTLKFSFIFATLFLAVAFICCHYGYHIPGATVMMGIPMIGSQDMRIAYANTYKSLWAKATNNGANKNPSWLPNQGNKILSQGYLQSEILLNTSKTAYQFGINVNQLTNGQPVYVDERRLQLQDAFYVSSIGYYFKTVATGGGDTEFQYHLFTHPPGQQANGTNQNTLDALWDGNLSLSVNNRTVVPQWDLWRHYETPQTQYPFFGVASPTALYPINDEHYGSQSGVYPCEPMWLLDGAYDNVLNINYNAGLNTIGLGGSVHMVVILRGILAQNCSKLMEPGLMNPA